MRTAFILFVLIWFKSTAQSTLTIGSTNVVADTVYTGIDVPWEIIYGPDNHLWVTERKGIVSRIHPVAKTRTVVLDIQNLVYAVQESGLLGMALHPDFTTNNEVYIVYTFGTLQDIKERLVKYTYNAPNLVNPVILIDNIPGATAHNGSRLLFMADKTLLMTTGDAHIGTAPQSTAATNGKVLRINTNATVPSDNPFPGSFTYSFGHRNTQGLTMAPGGVYYISEHGTGQDDEFQILEKGRNYGWPDVQGFCNLPAEMTFCAANNVKEPILEWTPSIAPSDLVYYANNSFPEFDGRFLMTTLKNKQLVAIKLDVSGTSLVSQANYLTGMFGRLRDICVGPAKEIYLATNGPDAFNSQPNTHSILVLTPPQPTVSLREQPVTENAVKIYPSFSTEKITVEFGEIPDNNRAVFYDVTGRMVMDVPLRSKKSLITVSELTEGLYYIILKKNEVPIHYSRIFKQ